MNTTMKAMGLDLEEFRQVNVQRAIEGFRCYDNQPITYWTTALAGEVGELCNMIKKIQRVEKGGVDGGSSYSARDITPEMLKEEIGGIAIYLDLLASLLDISLEDAIVETFNNKSEKMGFRQFTRLKKPDERMED
jgi:NTP pyrophosphatase (non-canonical NTP hydrolase)